MKVKVLLGAVALAGLATTPSFALFCSNEGPKVPDIVVYRDGEPERRVDNDGQKDMDLQRLRSAGVDARSVERWNGCLRAFTTAADGSQAMEFYDPSSLERLQ